MLELFELKSKLLKQKIKVVKSLKQYLTYKIILTKATISISSNKQKRKKRLLEDQKNSQQLQSIEIYKVNASLSN